jgi:iron complex outermembrane receptor protein
MTTSRRTARSCPIHLLVAMLAFQSGWLAQAEAQDAGTPAEPADAGPPAAEAAPAAPPAEATDAAVAESDAAMVAEPPAESGEVIAAGAAGPTAEMVVTAQRTEQDVQKTPVAVSAFGTHSMEQRGVTNLQDVGKFTPNLELHSTNRPAGGGSAYAAYIRGIGTGDFQFPTDPGVGLYIDDVYIARTVGGLLSTDADIERIEVIKGPQGTLFGRNTIGGALNIVTSKPRLSGPATGSGLVRVGGYGRHDFAVNVNGPLIEHVMGGKLSLAAVHSDGYGKQILSDLKTNSEERFVARGGLLFQLAKSFDLRLDADYTHQNQVPPNGAVLSFAPMGPTLDKINKYNQYAAPALNPGLGLPAGSIVDERWNSPTAYDNYALQPSYDRYDTGGGSLRFNLTPERWFNLKSITAVRVLSSNIAVDGDQTPYPLQSSHTKLDDTQYSEELQLAGRFWEDRLSYLVGFYAFRESGNSTVDTQSFHGLFENEPTPIPADAGDTLTTYKMVATSYAAFTQETLRLIDALHLTLGARINHDQKDYDYGVDRPQLGVPQVPNSHAQASWDSFTPKLGADYSPIEALMVYASYSQGFKSGGFGPSNNPNNPTPKYGPETVIAYELGVKTHWFEGRKLLTNVTGFYNDYRDIQLTVQSRDPVTGANLRTTENAGTSHIKGFEADLTALPVEGLMLNAGVGYVDAKFHSLTPDALMSGFKVGDRLPQVPDWSINGGAQYGIRTGAGELTLRADLTFKGSQYLTPVDPSSFQKAYTLIAARISFVPKALDGLELSLYGLNLADTRYYIYRATLAPTGQQLAIAGAPRLIFASAKYLF